MKKFIMFDGAGGESELGYDPGTGWAIAADVRSVEFEDGTVLENPDFNLSAVKQRKISELQDQLIELGKNEAMANQMGLEEKEVEIENQIAEINAKIQAIRDIEENG